jgi:hypothetical protein
VLATFSIKNPQSLGATWAVKRLQPAKPLTDFPSGEIDKVMAGVFSLCGMLRKRFLPSLGLV